MRRLVVVKAIETLERIGSARGNEVRIAPSIADGGGGGFLSGELLLISLGSCVLGSVRHWLAANGGAPQDIEVTVQQLPSQTDEPGQILVWLSIDRPALGDMTGELRAKAFSGGVSRRLLRGTKVSLLFADEARHLADELQNCNGRDM